MAEIQENNSGKGKEGKGKQKKMTIRVDFTPMVDMNMLLITFFMLCTSLSKPQTMEISMPTKDTQEDMQTKVANLIIRTIRRSRRRLTLRTACVRFCWRVMPTSWHGSTN